MTENSVFFTIICKLFHTKMCPHLTISTSSTKGFLTACSMGSPCSLTSGLVMASEAEESLLAGPGAGARGSRYTWTNQR